MTSVIQIYYYLFAIATLVTVFIIFAMFVTCVLLMNASRQHNAVMDKLEEILDVIAN